MKFLQTLLASVLGVFIAILIVTGIFFLIVLSSSQEPEPYIRDNSVLEIEITGSIPDRLSDNPFEELFGHGRGDEVSLETLRENFEKAAAHDHIKGVVLEIDNVSESWASLEEVRQIINEFKEESDKFIYATTNDIGFNEAGYFLATAADSVFSPAESFFEFDGFYLQSAFYAGLFEKFGIEAEVSRVGDFKGAAEPFIREEFSEENEVQLQAILEDVSTTFIDAVSAKTGKSGDDIDRLMNDLSGIMASNAYEEGLLDSLLYEDELDSLLKKRLDLSEDDDLNTVSNKRYTKVRSSTAGVSSPGTDDEIAVIYADGPIVYESQDQNPFNGESVITASFFEEQLDKIKDDDDIKAVVVRINSPGGSSSTSDVIWHMLRETSEDIPVITSMGSVAASGGYYIGMGGDSIVAEPTTITGSIGVFMAKLNLQELFNEELGITFDEVKSHEHADWMNSTRGLDDEESQKLRQFTDQVYDLFITKVADSRNLTKEEVDEVAQGRVWTGSDALEEELVDTLGGLDTALRLAAEQAGIEGYNVRNYPEPKGIIEMFTGSAEAKVKNWMSGWFVPNETLNGLNTTLKKEKGETLLLYPFDLHID